MSSENVLVLSKDSFDANVTSTSGKVAVDFWAEWCGPCKKLSPILDEIAQAHTGKIKVAKVNIDENGDLATRFNIRAIPTIVVFENGEVKDQLVGLLSRKELEEKLGLA